MAAKITLWFAGIGVATYLGTVLFSIRDEQVREVLAEKKYAEAPTEDARKKMMFMHVIHSAAYGGEPIYRQSKEEIQAALHKK